LTLEWESKLGTNLHLEANPIPGLYRFSFFNFEENLCFLLKNNLIRDIRHVLSVRKKIQVYIFSIMKLGVGWGSSGIEHTIVRGGLH
jgi:hypothetical protein